MHRAWRLFKTVQNLTEVAELLRIQAECVPDLCQTTNRSPQLRLIDVIHTSFVFSVGCHGMLTALCRDICASLPYVSPTIIHQGQADGQLCMSSWLCTSAISVSHALGVVFETFRRPICDSVPLKSGLLEAICVPALFIPRSVFFLLIHTAGFFPLVSEYGLSTPLSCSLSLPLLSSPTLTDIAPPKKRLQDQELFAQLICPNLLSVSSFPSPRRTLVLRMTRGSSRIVLRTSSCVRVDAS